MARYRKVGEIYEPEPEPEESFRDYAIGGVYGCILFALLLAFGVI